MKKIIFYILALVTAACMFWSLWTIILEKYYLNKNFKYSITTSITSIGSGKGGSDEKYEFMVKSKIYSGWTSGSLSHNKHYFIKFYPPDPNYNETTFIEAKSYDIENLPPEGYNQLPRY